MPRSRALQRHHRERVINNRLAIIRTAYGGRYGLTRGPGVLDKDHLTDCSCCGCKPHRYGPKRRYGGRVSLEGW